MKKVNKNNRTWLIAEEGKVLTDGKETYGYIVILALGESGEEFYEIPVAEYEALMAVEAAEELL